MCRRKKRTEEDGVRSRNEENDGESNDEMGGELMHVPEQSLY